MCIKKAIWTIEADLSWTMTFVLLFIREILLTLEVCRYCSLILLQRKIPDTHQDRKACFNTQIDLITGIPYIVKKIKLIHVLWRKLTQQLLLQNFTVQFFLVTCTCLLTLTDYRKKSKLFYRQKWLQWAWQPVSWHRGCVGTRSWSWPTCSNRSPGSWWCTETAPPLDPLPRKTLVSQTATYKHIWEHVW